MVTPELENYIRASLSQGRTRDEVKFELKQKGGWTEDDLNEAFTKNGTSGIFLKILMPLLMIGLGIGGYFVYNSDAFQQIFLKRDNPNEAILPENLLQDAKSDHTLSVTYSNSNNLVEQTSPLLEKNCGVVEINYGHSTSFKSFEDWVSFYKFDSALKCLGESALSCTNAKVTIENPQTYYLNKHLNKEIKSPTLQIINASNTCYFKITEINEQYNKCPLSIVKKTSENPRRRPVQKWLNLESMDITNSIRYALEIYLYGEGLIFDIPNEATFKNLGCKGNLFPLARKDLETLQTNIVRKIQSDIIFKITTEAQEYYNKQKNASYKNICQDIDFRISMQQFLALGIEETKCFDSLESYAIAIPLPLHGFYCADNEGFKGEINSNITSPNCK